MFWVAAQIVIILAWFILVALGERYYPPDGIRYLIEGLGTVMIIAGLGMIRKGVYDLGKNLTPLPAPKPDLGIVTHGIYGRVRHPMYGGTMLAIVGASIVFITPQAIPMVIVIIAFFYAKSIHEERLLAGSYPEYREHITRTRRFVPYIW
jgi:protein-S-isoprenylcysteine O-methyltransferase Ste14